MKMGLPQLSSLIARELRKQFQKTLALKHHQIQTEFQTKDTYKIISPRPEKGSFSTVSHLDQRTKADDFQKDFRPELVPDNTSPNLHLNFNKL